MITSKSFIHIKPLRTQRRYENAFTQKYTHTFMDINYTAIRNWWIYLRLCATLDKILGHHTSNSVWDTSWALLWPAVVGSLMISPAWLKQCNGFHWGQGFLNYLLSWWSTWVRVRDLQARPAMKWTATINCNWLHVLLIFLSFFFVFSQNAFFLLSLLYFAAHGSEVVWKQRFLISNHKIRWYRFSSCNEVTAVHCLFNVSYFKINSVNNCNFEITINHN